MDKVPTIPTTTEKYQTIDTPDGPVEFPIDMSDEEISAVLAQQFPPEKELSWKEVGEKADASFQQTARDFGKRLKGDTPYMETVGDVGEGIAKVATSFADHPGQFTWDFGKGVVHAFKEGVEDVGHVTLGAIPGIEKLDELTGAPKGRWAEERRSLKRRLAEKPIETGLNMFSVPGTVYQLPRAAVRLYQAGSGAAKIASMLRGGLTPEEAEAARLAIGKDATLLDALPPKQQAKVMKLLGNASPEEIAPLKQKLLGRKDAKADRWRRTVENAEGMRSGDLIDPAEYLSGVEAANEQTANIYKAGGAALREQVVKDNAARHAAELADMKAKRDKLYPEAFTKGEAIGLDGFDDIFQIPMVQDILAKYPDLSKGYGITRKGEGKLGEMGNLEVLDRLEQDLTEIAKNPGTVEGRLAAETAAMIRKRLAEQVDPFIPEYPQARDLHAKIKQTPETPPKPALPPDIPPEVAQSLEENLKIATDRIKMAKPATLEKWRDLPDGIAEQVPDHVTHAARVALQKGVKVEDIYETTLKALPKGQRNSFSNWFRQWGGTGGGAATLWAAHLLGLDSDLLKLGVGMKTTYDIGKHLLGRQKARQARHGIKQLLGEEDAPTTIHVEPVAPIDWVNLSYLLANQGAKEGEAGHH